MVFEPSSYGSEPATRVDLTVRPQAETRQQLEELDQYIISYVADHSEQFFGKKLSLDEVQGRYNPCLKPNDKWEPTMKVKMNISGPGPVRVWNAEDVKCQPPSTWKGKTLSVIVRLKSIYFMAKAFGCVLDATDIRCADQAEEPEDECPF